MDQILAELQKKWTCSPSSETTAASDKEYLCAKCKDDGGFSVLKKAGEKTIVKDFDGVFREMTLKYDTNEWQECECAKMRRINRLIKSSAITEEFQKMGFKNFSIDGRTEQVVRMKDLAILYYRNFKELQNERVNSVLFIGQPGCGKTHLLTAISNCLMYEYQVPVLYFPFKDGMNNISANDFERKTEIMQQMKDIEVLFIDDLFKPIGGKLEYDRNGIPKIVKWQADIVYEVVNHRYLNKLPLFISTELTIEELLLIDEATGSRIFEMAEDFTVTIDKNMNNNYRLRKLQGA